MATRAQRKPPIATAAAAIPAAEQQETRAVMLPTDRGLQSVGDYLPGVVYHVLADEARRLVEVKHFRYVSVAEGADLAEPLNAVPLASSDPAAATAPGEGGGAFPEDARPGVPVNQQDEE